MGMFLSVEEKWVLLIITHVYNIVASFVVGKCLLVSLELWLVYAGMMI